MTHTIHEVKSAETRRWQVLSQLEGPQIPRRAILIEYLSDEFQGETENRWNVLTEMLLLIVERLLKLTSVRIRLVTSYEHDGMNVTTVSTNDTIYSSVRKSI